MFRALIAACLRLRAAMLAVGFGLAASGPVAAGVELQLGDSGDPAVTLVELNGPIERGDAQRVQAFLASMPQGRQIAVRLRSPGGLIDEALRMGRHFHANGIRTYVIGAGHECLSACALAFLGGRDANGATFRVKGSQAQVGFHGFRRLVPGKEFTVADMHEAIATTQRIILMIADYLAAVDADIEFMSLMLEKPNSDMNYLDDDKAPAIGVHVLEEITGRLTAATPPKTP